MQQLVREQFKRRYAFAILMVLAQLGASSQAESADAADAAPAPAPASFRDFGVNAAGARIFERSTDGATVVWIPGGEFEMAEYVPFSTDEPLFESVAVPGFAIDLCEVSAAQMAAFLAASAVGESGAAGGHKLIEAVADGLAFDGKSWRPTEGSENLPALGVTGWGAMAYARWVGGDLPTIAQWQKAASGSKWRTYPWGEAPVDAARANSRPAGHDRPIAVGSLPAGASPYGVLDMAGNVYERVYSARRGGETMPVMIRGGSWASPHPLNLRTWDLCMQSMDAAERTVGFRCVNVAGAGLPTTPAPLQTLRLATSWDAAIAEARARNCVLIVTLHYDTCGQCDRTKVGLYRDPEFVRTVNERCVMLAGQWPGDAEDEPHPPLADGACPYWPGISCADHMRIFSEIFQRIGEFGISPATFIIDPRTSDDDELSTRILVGEREVPRWGGGAGDFVAVIAKAQAKLGEPLPPSKDE